MAQTFIQQGNTMRHKATAAIANGSIVTVGELCGIADADALQGEDVILLVSGVHSLPKDGAKIDQGAKVYLVSGKVSATKTDAEPVVGIAFAPALADDAVCAVLLNGVPSN
jgi:predicted RecA/RadA family phage recombinase